MGEGRRDRRRGGGGGAAPPLPSVCVERERERELREGAHGIGAATVG